VPRRVLVLRFDVLFCIRSCCPPAPPCSNLKPDGPQQKRFCAAALGRAFSLCWLCLCPHAHPPHLPLLLCVFLIIHPAWALCWPALVFFACLLPVRVRFCPLLPCRCLTERVVLLLWLLWRAAPFKPRAHTSAPLWAPHLLLTSSTQREF